MHPTAIAPFTSFKNYPTATHFKARPRAKQQPLIWIRPKPNRETIVRQKLNIGLLAAVPLMSLSAFFKPLPIKLLGLGAAISAPLISIAIGLFQHATQWNSSPLNSGRPTLAYVTGNEHKLREAVDSLTRQNSPYRVVGLKLNDEAPNEDSLSFAENAVIKLRHAFNNLQDKELPKSVVGLVSNDGGVEILSLKGMYGLDQFPGVETKRWFEELPEYERQRLLGHAFKKKDYTTTFNQANQAILTLLQDKNDRTGKAHDYLAYQTLNAAWKPLIAHGETVFQIAQEPRGPVTYGLHPLAIPEKINDSRTFAEIQQANPELASSLYAPAKAWAQLNDRLPQTIHSA